MKQNVYSGAQSSMDWKALNLNRSTVSDKAWQSGGSPTWEELLASILSSIPKVRVKKSCYDGSQHLHLESGKVPYRHRGSVYEQKQIEWIVACMHVIRATPYNKVLATQEAVT